MFIIAHQLTGPARDTSQCWTKQTFRWNSEQLGFCIDSQLLGLPVISLSFRTNERHSTGLTLSTSAQWILLKKASRENITFHLVHLSVSRWRRYVRLLYFSVSFGSRDSLFIFFFLNVLTHFLVLDSKSLIQNR